MEIFEELKQRGLVAQFTNEEEIKKFKLSCDTLNSYYRELELWYQFYNSSSIIILYPFFIRSSAVTPLPFIRVLEKVPS